MSEYLYMLPLVSVIIPTYNRKDMLKIAIDSVLKQDYKNIEIMVSDNASTDGTDVLMQEYCETYDNIRYIKRQKNIGAIFNSKEAYKIITGKYLIFLCDDDYLISPTFFTNAVKSMENDSNIVIVKGIVKTYYYKENRYSLSSHNSKEYIKGIDYFLNYEKYGYDHITSTFALIRKETFDKCGRFDKFYLDYLTENWWYLY